MPGIDLGRPYVKPEGPCQKKVTSRDLTDVRAKTGPWVATKFNGTVYKMKNRDYFKTSAFTEYTFINRKARLASHFKNYNSRHIIAS